MIGDKIRVARAMKRITQEQLAGKAGISRATLRNIENGKTQNMSIKTAMAIADALEISLAFLLYD